MRTPRYVIFLLLLTTLMVDSLYLNASGASFQTRAAICSEALSGSFKSDADATAFLNQRFNGSIPFPVDKQVTFSNPDTGKEMTVRIQRISLLNKNFQLVIEQLKKNSVSNQNVIFRESGAFYFNYEHLLDSAVLFSSDLPNQIKMDAHIKAIDQEKILEKLEQNANQVVAVFHFHTHPGIEFRKGTDKDYKDLGLLPNWGDFAAYEYFASLFQHHAKKRIPFVGIVIPMGENCDDVYFDVSVDPDEKVVQRIHCRNSSRHLLD